MSQLASNEVFQKYSARSGTPGTVTSHPDKGIVEDPIPSIPEDPAVAQELVDEWDTVTKQREEAEAGSQFSLSSDPAARKAEKQPKDMPITVKDALEGIHKDGKWKDTLEGLQRVSTAITNGGLMTKLWQCFTPSLSGELGDERDFILCLKDVSLDLTKVVHQRVLTSIYRRVTNERGAVALGGSHFEKIGFQGGNPATDLRCTGIFGLIQMLYFIEKSPKLVNQSYAIAMNPMLEFTWALVSLNFTAAAYDALKDQVLNKFINQQKSVLTVMCELHMGLFCLFTEEWRSQEKRTITEFDPIKKKLVAKARSDPGGCIQAYKKFTEKGFVKLGDGKPLEFTEF